MGDRVQMDIRKRKQNTLFWLFFKQILMFSLCVLVEIILFYALFQIGLNTNIILPANYSERVIEKNKEAIAQSEPFDVSLIPNTSTYGIFDTNHQYIEGTFDANMIEEARNVIKNESRSEYIFYIIPRAEGVCVIQYDINVHFSSSFLNRIFPKPEMTAIFAFLLVFIGILVSSAASVGKKLKRELSPVLEVVDQIQRKELQFEAKYSAITELNQVLIALNDMRIALSQSLEHEWETEQIRKSHISALAHDIRTPLTIMKGNAELILDETELTQIYENATIINDNTDKIERYIKLLIDATKGEPIVATNNKSISIMSLISEIIFEAEILCKTQNISLETKVSHHNEIVIVDQELILRAILNIVKNAIEHSKSGTKVCVEFIYEEGILQVSIEDFGAGFSEEALGNATKQFYTDRKERANENYGLGMYIASVVAESYGGTIEFFNKSEEGAIVVICFKL